jgi:hypothetical protein
MKIQFLKTFRDPYDSNRYYQPGWVAEFTDPDAGRVIEAGFAKPAPVNAFCRKYAAPNLVSADCVTTTITMINEPVEYAPTDWEFKPTGDTTDLGGLIQEKTYPAAEIEEAEKRRGFPFTKAGTKK